MLAFDAEGAGNLAFSRLAGMLADEGKKVLLRGKGFVVMFRQ